MFKKSCVTFCLTLLTVQAQATYILPSDYEDAQRFIKVEKVEDQTRQKTIYHYSECQGDLKSYSCTSIFPGGHTELELNSLERNESLKGTGLLIAEIVTGGFIWKRITKFTLEKTNQMVIKKVARDPRYSHWRGQDVATGIVSLGIAAPVSAGATVAVLHTVNKTLEAIDPFDKFHRSELVDTDEFQDDQAIMAIDEDFVEAITKLRDILL
jgi:hypothetical protein